MFLVTQMTGRGDRRGEGPSSYTPQGCCIDVASRPAAGLGHTSTLLCWKSVPTFLAVLWRVVAAHSRTWGRGSRSTSGGGGRGRPCGGFRVSAPGVFCLRLYCSMAYLCHLGLPGVYVTLWARIRYKTASFLASSSSGQLGAFGCRSIPIARQPVMVGLWGALSPSLSGIVRFPRLPVYVPCPLPGSAGSLRRPRPLSLEVVSEAGVWVLGAPGYRGVVACRASQRTACARTHKPLCVERLCPGDADREVAPAPLALPRQSPGA